MSARRRNSADAKAQLVKRLDVLERLLALKTLCPTCGQVRSESPEQQQLKVLIAELRAVCTGDAT